MAFLVLTYDPDDPKGDGECALQRLLDEYQVFGHAVAGWGSVTKEGVEPGTLALLLQQGPGPRGMFAEGEVLAPPFRAKANPNLPRRDWLIVAVYFWKVIDPRSEAFLYGAAACEGMGIDLNQRASGMLYADKPEAAP